MYHNKRFIWNEYRGENVKTNLWCRRYIVTFIWRNKHALQDIIHWTNVKLDSIRENVQDHQKNNYRPIDRIAIKALFNFFMLTSIYKSNLVFVILFIVFFTENNYLHFVLLKYFHCNIINIRQNVAMYCSYS